MGTLGVIQPTPYGYSRAFKEIGPGIEPERYTSVPLKQGTPLFPGHAQYQNGSRSQALIKQIVTAESQ